MSYANRNQMSQNRVVPILIAAALNLGLGYALVSGLAYSVVKKAAQDLKTFDVEEEPPPPPDEPPPPPENIPEVPPPVVAPPPIVRTNVTPPPIVSVPVAPPVVVTRTAPPAPPAPPAPKIIPARAKGSIIGLFSTDDYPSAALNAGAEGSTVVQYTVGTNGKVSGCDVISSSGNAALDAATCRVIRSRARFTPATNESGQKVTDTGTQKVTWKIPN